MRDRELQLVFLDLPPEVLSGSLTIAPPLGTQAEVRRQVARCFTGLGFDDSGRGVIQRPAGTLAFQVDDAEPAHGVFVTVRGGPAALIPLRRLAQMTGWRAFDAATNQALDLSDTGAVMRSRSGGEAAGEGTTPWGSALGGLALTASLALGLAWQPRLRASPEVSEQQILRDIRELEEAEMALAQTNGGYVDPEILATPGRYPAMMAADRPSGRFLDARFLSPVRNGYRFEFRGLEPCADDHECARFVKPTFRDFAYAALPEPGGPGRRSFAYYSYRVGVVYVRDDRQLPSIDDTMLPLH